MDQVATVAGLRVYGDIHEAAGIVAPPEGADGRTTVNASVLDLRYWLVHPPVVLDL